MNYQQQEKIERKQKSRKPDYVLLLKNGIVEHLEATVFDSQLIELVRLNGEPLELFNSVEYNGKQQFYEIGEQGNLQGVRYNHGRRGRPSLMTPGNIAEEYLSLLSIRDFGKANYENSLREITHTMDSNIKGYKGSIMRDLDRLEKE
tara:strand:+ start:39417 stop:39857 length:441 start_codon:yes stop_codon:yes gene_type:complete